MPVESWTKPEETPALAATATAMIDAALVGSGLARDAYWAAVRKGYNTPYNDPQPKPAPAPTAPQPPVRIDLGEAPALPVAAMAAQNAATEIHAG
ncbi:hypothetical protein [Methylobacterium sp. J-092]|uniref:hypothetical protein n=1 Tax=Methylobacterium sp. J-092 TaxID=2836667 RepID=UPI001FBB8B8E|nr:hypothetical protein [Methylobacterium sp. J-092]MCJ2008509.1 hypothetical protein [Methylobacterium sp. J-092]